MFNKVYKSGVLIAFLILISRLFYLQVVKGAYFYDLSVNNYLRILPLPGFRGNILDRYGREIAGNKLSFCIQILPDKVKDKKSVFGMLSQDLGLDINALQENYKKGFRAVFQPVKVAEDIPKDKAIYLKEKYRQVPGVMVEEEVKRIYPYENLCSHVLGYLGQLSQQELMELKPYGYRFHSLIGKSGIEKFYEPYLKGNDGGMLVKVDNQGRIKDILGKQSPTRGLDVYLTLDLDLQKKAEQILGEERGCIMVMDVHTGELLVMVSHPNFDPNVFLELDESKISHYLSSWDHPLYNRCIQAVYPLGSIFKLVTATAGLESGALSSTTRFKCPGYFEFGGRRYRCWKKEGHGWQNMGEAITHSCNVYFYQAGLKVGWKNIISYARIYGLGNRTGIDLPYENKGLLPTPEWKLKIKGEQWYPGDTVNLSIGQGYLLVTPIQVLRFIAVIANGGYLVTPHICKAISGESTGKHLPQKLSVKNSTLKFLRRAMYAVVNSPTGTGQLARLRGIKIAGKTATAQNPSGRPHAWFVGFAPYTDPEIAFLFFVENGGGGGFITARMAKEFLEYYFRHKGKEL
ncbi:MAG: penicillin-binding protein 2 [Candidatus Omnitrophica bacterium]|nr:penicillin-binding protein 2 [Candidatus Omnitrophota bacterium]